MKICDLIFCQQSFIIGLQIFTQKFAHSKTKQKLLKRYICENAALNVLANMFLIWQHNQSWKLLDFTAVWEITGVMVFFFSVFIAFCDSYSHTSFPRAQLTNRQNRKMVILKGQGQCKLNNHIVHGLYFWYILLHML